MERFVDQSFNLPHFQTNEILVEDLEADAVGFLSISTSFVFIRRQPHFSPFRYIFDRLSIWCIVH